MDTETLLFIVAIDALILLPVFFYMVEGRTYRRDMILAYFSPDVVSNYFGQFWSGDNGYSELIQKYKNAIADAKLAPADDATNETRATAKQSAEISLTDAFRDLYDQRYGSLKYFVPLLVLGLVLTLEAIFVAEFAELLLAKNAQTLTGTPVGDDLVAALLGVPGVLRLPDKVTVAAIAGAYLAVGLDLLRRTSSLTLLPSDVWFYALRLIVAPVLGYAIGAFATADSSMVAAFTITLLPIADMLLWIRTRTAKVVGMEERPEEARDKPIKLPGVDTVVAARLEDQGVSTIAQLCEVDPVLLSMRTGYDFTYIVRLVDAAIAWRYFNDKLPALCTYGWTGASTILSRASGTGSGSTSSQEEIRYQDTFIEMREAKTKSDANPADPALADAVKAANTKFDAARQAMKEAIQYQFNKQLILAIAADNKLGLVGDGIENIVRQINNDEYARFIDGLLRSAGGKSMPRQPEGFLGWLGRFFSGRG
jgi:hypothetical protein